MDMKFCQSCGMPISGPAGAKARGDYCEYCTEADGSLKPKEVVQQGITQWLLGFSPGATPEQCSQRAARYLSAMPAWAE